METRWPLQPSARTLFRVGLMDWVGDRPAKADDLAECAVLEQGWAHVGIIQKYGSTIDGCRTLESDGIVADQSEQGVYGAEVLRILAYKHYGEIPADRH